MNPSQYRHYCRLLHKGFPKPKAVEIATAPFAGYATMGLDTDTNRWSQFQPPAPHEVAAARKAGIDIVGKKRCCQLGTGLTDPDSWISSTDELEAKCRVKGIGATRCGKTRVAGPSADGPDPREETYRPARDVVANEVRQTLANEGVTDISPKELTELAHKTRKRISGNSDTTGAAIKFKD